MGTSGNRITFLCHEGQKSTLNACFVFSWVISKIATQCEGKKVFASDLSFWVNVEVNPNQGPSHL